LITLSQEVKTSSWDKYFVREVEDKITQQVLPGVREIEEAVKSNKSLLKYFPNAINTIQKASVLVPTSILGAVLVKNGELPIDSNAVICGCGIAAMGSLALEIHNKKKEEKNQIENNGLYLVYKVKEKLKNL
jgi:hypothetical protein